MLQALNNNYACLQAHVNNALTWQSSCVIANNARKQQMLFVQGYNLEVHDVIKYTRKHRATIVSMVLQNVTGAYVIIVLVYRRLLTTSLGGKAAA